MHVLIVDDNQSIREITKMFCQQLGHHVTEAKDGDEALKIILRPESQIEAMITDYNMPKMSGQELIEKILHLGITLHKIVMFSGEIENLKRMELLLQENKNIHFYTKPFKYDDVMRHF